MTWIMYILYYYAYIFYTYVDYLYITYFFFVIISLLTLMFHFSYWWASSVLKHKRDLQCSSKEMKISCNDIYVKVKMPFNYLCLHFINFHFLWMSEINSQYSLDVHILLFFSFVDLLCLFLKILTFHIMTTNCVVETPFEHGIIVMKFLNEDNLLHLSLWLPHLFRVKNCSFQVLCKKCSFQVLWAWFYHHKTLKSLKSNTVNAIKETFWAKHLTTINFPIQVDF